MAHQGGLPKLVAVGAKPPSEGDDVSNQPLSAVAAGSSSNPGVVKPVSFIAEVESLEGYVDVPMLPPGATSLPKPLLLDEAIPSDNDDDEFTGDDPCPTTDAEDTNAGADEQRIRKKKRSVFDFKKMEDCLEAPKRRTQLAKVRGTALVNAAKGMVARTGAQVYLKCQYTSPQNKVYNFCYGKDFPMMPGGTGDVPTTVVPEKAPEKASLDVSSLSEDLVKIVAEGVTSGLASQQTPRSSRDALGEDDGGDFNSPKVGARRTLLARKKISAAGMCQRCLREDEFVSDGLGGLVPAKWFKCCFPDCNGRVHDNCANFPGADYDKLVAVAPFYCQVHLGAGRPALHAQAEEVAASTLPAATAGVTTRSTTAGRGSAGKAAETGSKARGRGRGKK